MSEREVTAAEPKVEEVVDEFYGAKEDALSYVDDSVERLKIEREGFGWVRPRQRQG